MAAQKLTSTKIDKYRPAKNDENLADGNGLFLRFRRGHSGSLTRTWMYTYKVGTRSIYLTLGEHDTCLSDFHADAYSLSSEARLTLENARKIASELTGWRKRGVDPKDFLQSEAERQQREAELAAKAFAANAEAEAAIQRQIEAENLSFQDLFDSWLLDGVRRKDGNAELRRSFAADVLPKVGLKPIKELTEHDLRAALRAVVTRGANRAAVIMRNNLTQMFAWAEKRQPWRKLLVDGNPMELIEIEKIVSQDYDLTNQRDRILSIDEIRELDNILSRLHLEYQDAPNKRVVAQPLEPTTQCAIWIMLSTLCRVGEMSMARWEHVNLDTSEWFIPKQNVKGNLADLRVYLSSFAAEQFQSLRAITGHSDWCFPARNNEGHVCVKSISKQIGDRQSKFKTSKDGSPRAPMKNRRHDNTLVLGGGVQGAWTPHDLRRTGATLMQSLGISLEIIDRCQNHVLPGSKVRRHYLHHDYADEKRHAWHTLGALLATILSGSKSAEHLLPKA